MFSENRHDLAERMLFSVDIRTWGPILHILYMHVQVSLIGGLEYELEWEMDYGLEF